MTDVQRPDVYVLNRNVGIDTLHRNPSEVCNTDDAEDRQTIDEATALKLKLGGYARLCEHCYPAEAAIEEA